MPLFAASVVAPRRDARQIAALFLLFVFELLRDDALAHNMHRRCRCFSVRRVSFRAHIYLFSGDTKYADLPAVTPVLSQLQHMAEPHLYG